MLLLFVDTVCLNTPFKNHELIYLLSQTFCMWGYLHCVFVLANRETSYRNFFLTRYTINDFWKQLICFNMLFILHQSFHCGNSSQLQGHLSQCLDQRGPNTFDLRAILQKCDNSLATSNQMAYKTTDSRDLKLIRENRLVKLVCHWNYYTVTINNLLQIPIRAMPVIEASLILSFL